MFFCLNCGCLQPPTASTGRCPDCKTNSFERLTELSEEEWKAWVEFCDKYGIQNPFPPRPSRDGEPKQEVFNF